MNMLAQKIRFWNWECFKRFKRRFEFPEEASSRPVDIRAREQCLHVHQRIGDIQG